MAPEEQARLTLYAWMRETADDEKAEALMAGLPPTRWPELATKHDIALLKQDVDLLRTEMVAMNHELLATFREETTRAVTNQTRTVTFQMVGLFLAFAGFSWAAR